MEPGRLGSTLDCGSPYNAETRPVIKHTNGVPMNGPMTIYRVEGEWVGHWIYISSSTACCDPQLAREIVFLNRTVKRSARRNIEMTAILRCPSAAVSIYLFIYLCTVCVCVCDPSRSFCFAQRIEDSKVGKLRFPTEIGNNWRSKVELKGTVMTLLVLKFIKMILKKNENEPKKIKSDCAW